MTNTEKELLQIIGEMYIALNDVHHHLSEESKGDAEAQSEAVRKRAAYLTPCGQTLGRVRANLRNLGAKV